MRQFRGIMLDGSQVLVTLWETGDGDVELITRPGDNTTWGPPVPLQEVTDG